MKHAITNRMKMVAGLFVLVAATGVQATEFTWTSGAGDNNDALWGATWSANWQGGSVPLDNPGDTVIITNSWPTTAYGTRTIQIRQDTTFGILNVSTAEGDAKISRQISQDFFFDNNGSPAQVNGDGLNKLTLNAMMNATDTIEFHVNGMSEIRLDKAISGNGGVTVTGNGVDNELYYASTDGYTYTGDTRITSGRLLMAAGVTSLGSTNIIVNGTWDTTPSTSTGYTLSFFQTLSGTGTVAMYAGINAESRALKSNGATIAPGDDGIGTLTISGAGLSLTGGTNVFEIGEASSDQIAPNRLWLSATPGTVQIVDGGRTSTGTVTLFTRKADSGTVDDLSLVLPANYTANLVDSGSSIDLNITDIELPPAGTVVTIK